MNWYIIANELGENLFAKVFFLSPTTSSFGMPKWAMSNNLGHYSIDLVYEIIFFNATVLYHSSFHALESPQLSAGLSTL